MSVINLHGVKLDLPPEHALPNIKKILPDYSKSVGRLAACVESKYPGRGFVDVGANVGDTAAIVSAHSNLPILCIEGSDDFKVLKRNVPNIGADIEIEYATLDTGGGERSGQLVAEPSFHANSGAGPATRFERLDSILARHPRFQSAKVLKLDTDGMDGRIILGALDWIREARPVLFWEHDIGRDAAAGGPELSIFRRLFDLGYRTAIVFDNRGDYIQTLSLNAHEQLADLSDYLPGGENLYGYCDICAFHEDDMDLCARMRQVELHNRRLRRPNSAMPLNEPLFRALVETQFSAQRVEVTTAIHDAFAEALERMASVANTSTLSEQLATKTVELQVLRAQSEAERYRLDVRLRDEEKRSSAKDTELQRLLALLSNLAATRSDSYPIRPPESPDLLAQLMQAKAENASLRHALDTSLALRMARSLHVILEPIRRLLGPGDRP